MSLVLFGRKVVLMGKIRSSSQAEVIADAAYAVDPDTDGLLLNWGRWQAATGRSGSPESGMWRFASRGTRAAAYATLTVPVDVDQARKVEVEVCHSAFSPKFRDLLKAHYVVNNHPNRTCTALGLHHGAYAEWVWRATTYFGDRWRRLYRAKGD
jgi:hypothetical protein